jgi:hypothetical protein
MVVQQSVVVETKYFKNGPMLFYSRGAITFISFITYWLQCAKSTTGFDNDYNFSDTAKFLSTK